MSLYDDLMQGHRKEILGDALYRHGGHFQKTAAYLGIHRNTLTRLIAVSGVDVLRIQTLIRKKKLKVPYESYLCRGVDVTQRDNQPARTPLDVGLKYHGIRRLARVSKSSE